MHAVARAARQPHRDRPTAALHDHRPTAARHDHLDAAARHDHLDAAARHDHLDAAARHDHLDAARPPRRRQATWWHSAVALDRLMVGSWIGPSTPAEHHAITGRG
ncbi:hypothetical protein [Micromonospora sp. NPDC048947]|uniref:hypothetical protein n=1 Tax=Micromonospora sp. NPDC048947 TaxID=3154826 RepID=UPI0033D2C078